MKGIQNIRKEKGITLIALIVTIIVLIILAAVTIYALAGENNILNDAKNAKEVSRRAEAEEIMKLKLADLYAHDYIKPKRTLDLQEIANALCDDEDIEYVIKKNKETASLEYIDVSDVTSIYTKLKAYPYEFEIDETLRIKSVRNTEGETVEGTGPEEGPKDPVIADASGANTPKGNITGKQYVTWKWNEETKEYDENLTNTQPENWYNYENGQWANIKTTNNGLEAYWVWIPRYEYIVPTSEVATEIEVKFISKSKEEPDPGYIIHPAFKNEGNGGFGDLDGIWVAKYESVGTNDKGIISEGDNTNLKLQVIPNKTSWKYMEPANIFKVCRMLTNEGQVLQGSSVDSHMMRNTEWGAVAILSQSKYGIFNPKSSTGENGDKTFQVWNNPSERYYTGSVGSSKDASNGRISEYNSENGPKASTTGTVYGVYDMAGGANEFVAASTITDEDNIQSAINGFKLSSQVIPDGMETLDFAKKYLDLYNIKECGSDGKKTILGDAVSETRGWNLDANSMFLDYGYWITTRGGQAKTTTSAGIFAYCHGAGAWITTSSFRVVLVP